MIEIVVTGAARSGTGYMAQLLTGAGVPCGHEDVFGPGGVVSHPEFKASSSWMAAPFLGSDLLREAQVVHITRHPLDCIESLLSVGALRRDPWAAFMRHYLPRLENWESEADAAVCYWMEWNLMVEPWAQARYQVEDECPERLLAWLGIQHPGPLFDDRRYNRRPGYELVRLDLKTLNRGLRRRLEKQAARYRYVV